jgi:membrane fusion protein (multidrug efflux system)
MSESFLLPPLYIYRRLQPRAKPRLRWALGLALAAALVALPGRAQEKSDTPEKSDTQPKSDTKKKGDSKKKGDTQPKGDAKQKSATKGGAGSAQVTPVEVMPVERRDLVESLNLVGSFAANESAQVRAEIAGVVREIAFEEGQLVKKGQRLVKIDDSEVKAQADEAESAYQLAVLNQQRSDSLAKTSSVTQADRDRSVAEARSAQARLNLQLSRLEKTEIRAPFDGVVGTRTISPGDYVTSQSIITTVDDLSRLKIEFEVPERFAEKVHVGTAFDVRVSGGAAVPGEVYFASSAISRETRSSTAKGYLDKPPPTLKPGMFANVELVLEVHKNVLVAPESAILMTPSGAQLVLVRDKGADHLASIVRVELGIRSKGLVEVIPVGEKLRDHEIVVASGTGAILLYQDQKLDPRPLRKELQANAEKD